MIVSAHELTVGVALGRLLAYPDKSFAARLDAARRAIDLFGTEAAERLNRFGAALLPLAPDQREELFTRTFDINPIGALEIGWHLFGEDYHRGALLVRLRMELRRHGIEEAGELPDHLIHVLTLLDRMDADEAGDFANACVIPALEKMLDGFGARDNPYEHLLCCVAGVLTARFGRDSEACPRQEGEKTRRSLPIVYG